MENFKNKEKIISRIDSNELQTVLVESDTKRVRHKFKSAFQGAQVQSLLYLLVTTHRVLK